MSWQDILSYQLQPNVASYDFDINLRFSTIICVAILAYVNLARLIPTIGGSLLGDLTFPLEYFNEMLVKVFVLKDSISCMHPHEMTFDQ